MCPIQTTVFPVDAGSPGQPVNVSFPASAAANSPYQAIVARGNVPLLIEDCLLAEVPRAQLDSEWLACDQISDVEAADYCQRAASRLARAFDSGIAAADLPDIVANAAVLFLLTLRRSGIRSTAEISPCTVSYDSSSRIGRLNVAV